MKDWFDLNEKVGLKLLLYIEFWGFVVLFLFVIGVSYGFWFVDWMSVVFFEI